MRIHEQPEKRLASARDQGPADPHVLLHLGVANAGGGREEVAARQFQKLLKERPTDKEALHHLGRACLGLASEAYGHLGCARDSYPKLLTDLRAELDRPDAEVAERFRAAIRLAGSYPGLRVGLSTALASHRRVDEARRALAEMHSLVEAHPGNPAIRNLPGENYKEMPPLLTTGCATPPQTAFAHACSRQGYRDSNTYWR